MNITLFGGTGATGQLVIQKALSAGYQITVYARSPQKITINDINLRIVQGELTDIHKIDEAIRNADAVISVLGPDPKLKGLTIADGIKNIVGAMTKLGIKRLVATATPSFKDPNDRFQLSFSLAVFMVKTLMKVSYDNIVLAGKYITASGLDWTVVRLPMLSDKPSNGKVNAGYIGEGTIKLFSLSREDLAEFLLKQVEDQKWLKQSPAISN